MPPQDSTLQEIKDRVDIVDFVSQYVHLKQTGQNWKGLCPFHTEKTPSFTVSPAKQIYHCFGCGNGGDIFTFLMGYENLSFPEAVSILAKRAGVLLKDSRSSGVTAGEKEVLLNVHAEATRFFQASLKRDSAARAYLSKRGIDGKAVAAFAIGYAPKAWNSLLTQLSRKGHSADLMRKAGLAVKGEKGYYDTFRDRIMFPIHDLKGDVIAFGGRSVRGSEPKYLNSPETPIFNKRKVLYGLDRAKSAIKSTGYALCMEGYLDVIIAHSHGFENAVAPLGTALTREHGKLVKRFAETVNIVFDGDEAGVKAAKSAAAVLLESGLQTGIISLPGREDPDSFLRKKGGGAFQELVKAPLSVVDFLLAKQGATRTTAREIIDIIANVSDSVLQGQYAKELSERMKINEFFIIEELKKKRQKPSGRDQLQHRTAQPRQHPADEVFVVKLLLQLHERAEEIAQSLSSDDFRDERIRRIFERIRAGLTDFEQLLMQSEGEEKDLLVRISMKEDFDDPAKALDHCVKRLKDKRRKTILRELEVQIREAEGRKDRDELKKLQQRHQEILRSG